MGRGRGQVNRQTGIGSYGDPLTIAANFFCIKNRRQATMATFHNQSHVSGDIPKDETEQMAFFVYMAFSGMATFNESAQTSHVKNDTYQSRDGIIHSGKSFRTTSRQAWNRAYPEGQPDTITVMKVMRMLRRSGNVVCIERNLNTKEPSVWFVRDKYRPYSNVGASIRQPRVKVTAKEAGEDREPGEVIVRRGKKRKLSKLAMHKVSNLFGAFELWKCDKCAYTWTKKGVMTHIGRLDGKAGNREHGDLVIPCLVKESCPFVAGYGGELVAHMRIHHLDWLRDNPTEFCHKCGMTGTKKEIRAHQSSDHIKVKRRAKETAPKPKPVTVSTETAISTDDFVLRVAEMLQGEIATYLSELQQKAKVAETENERLKNQIQAMKDQFKNLFGSD
jgi:hypothetical protein